MKLEKSNSGKLCVWEKGGGWTNTGAATLVADKDGNKKTAIFVRRGGHLACSEHALIPVQVGDLIMFVSEHRGDVEISLRQISSIENEEARMIVLYKFEKNEWDNQPSENLNSFIQAGINKVNTYHCRSAYYVNEPQRKPQLTS